MRNKRRRIRWDRVALVLLALYLITGCAAAAIDSWRDPVKHRYCIINEIC